VQKFCSFMSYEYLSDNSNGLQWFEIKSDEDLDTNDDIMF
jgi:hypothetical protein